MLSLWLPSFAIQRRQRSAKRSEQAKISTSAGQPEYPLALTLRDGPRILLAAVDSAAAQAGAAPGQTLAEARALCPGLHSEAIAPAADRAALDKLTDWCSRYTPWVALDSAGEPGGAAGLWLDITGCAHLFGGEEALATELVARLARFGLTARIGIADTAGAAWACARHTTEAAQPIRSIAPGAQREALTPLSVAALRLPAAEAELLRRFGLSRIGDLLELPPAALEPRVGPVVARRLRQALGALDEPISPKTPVPPHLERLNFGEPIGTPEDIARAVERLLGKLCTKLEKDQSGGRKFALTAYRIDGSLSRLLVGTARPLRDAAHLKRLFAGKLEALDPGYGLEAMVLAAETLEPLTALQMTLEEGRAQADAKGPTSVKAAARHDLGRLVDRLGGRFGFERVHRLTPRESHLPERCVAPGPALPHRARSPSGRAGPAKVGTRRSLGWPEGPVRPIRLLTRPEPIEAIAAWPDAPPAQFRWRRLLHRVARAEGPERLSREWWLPQDEGAADRDYFRVEDEDGRRYWLYREESHWFLQGLFA